MSLPLGEGVTSLVRVTDEGSEQSERAIYAKQKFARSTDASHPTLIRRLSPPPSPEGRLSINRAFGDPFKIQSKVGGT